MSFLFPGIVKMSMRKLTPTAIFSLLVSTGVATLLFGATGYTRTAIHDTMLVALTDQDGGEEQVSVVPESGPEIEIIKPKVAAPAPSPTPPAVTQPAKPSGAQATPSTPSAPLTSLPVGQRSGTGKEVGSVLSSGLKQSCEKHFPSPMQSDVRLACAAAGSDYERLGHSLVETRCRLAYGEEPRLVMACLIGSSIAGELLLGPGHEDFKKKLQLCTETYPMHNEIDTVLHESCLTGIHIPDVVERDSPPRRGQDRVETCAAITPERLFLGACAVGLSLVQDDSSAVTPARQTAACEQYFDLKRFHSGYRACMSARSLAPQLQIQGQGKYLDAIKACANISSEVGNETERAACFVGLSIFRHLNKKDDVAVRFQKCGANKVTYQDRDFLACLTAASLLDFTDKNGAEVGCREIFKEPKSHGRADCANSLSLF